MIDVICLDRSGAIYRPGLCVCVCVLQTYHSVQDVLVSFGRRTLCYPLYRHFSLITRAVKDVACIFQSGELCPSFFICQLNPDPLSHFQANKGSGWESRLDAWPVPHPINPAVRPPHYKNPCCHHNESKSGSYSTSHLREGRFIIRLMFICQSYDLVKQTTQNGSIYVVNIISDLCHL